MKSRVSTKRRNGKESWKLFLQQPWINTSQLEIRTSRTRSHLARLIPGKPAFLNARSTRRSNFHTLLPSLLHFSRTSYDGGGKSSGHPGGNPRSETLNRKQFFRGSSLDETINLAANESLDFSNIANFLTSVNLSFTLPRRGVLSSRDESLSAVFWEKLEIRFRSTSSSGSFQKWTANEKKTKMESGKIIDGIALKVAAKVVFLHFHERSIIIKNGH